MDSEDDPDPFNGAPRSVAGFDPTANAGQYEYDPIRAEIPVAFFRDCIRHVDGDLAGKPFELEPWQKDIVRTMFGWYDPETNHRRFREVIIFVPRKNGKSTLAAGLSLFMLLCDNERRAQCYCAAGDREQASLVYSIAADMVTQHPAMDRSARVYRSQKRIVHKDRFLRAMAANDGAVHGTKPHWVCGDEIHVWKNFLLYEAFHTGTGASLRSMECYISTAGHDQETFGYYMYDRAKQVRDGLSDDRQLLPVLYEASKDDPWDDPATWAKANPNLGVSVTESFLQGEAERCKREITYLNTFLRLYLNIWTQQETAWLDMDSWDATQITQNKIEHGERVWLGMDLSSTTDFTALVAVAKRGDGFKVMGRYWLPEERAKYLSQKHSINIAKWVDEGYLTLCPGRRIEYRDYIEAEVLEWYRNYDVVSLAFDPCNAHSTRLALEVDNGVPMVEKKQTISEMSWPAKRLRALVMSMDIDHSGDPVLRWMAGNAAIRDPDKNENIQIVKRSGKKQLHVDGVVALAMAIGEAELEDGGTSMYDEPGTLYL